MRRKGLIIILFVLLAGLSVLILFIQKGKRNIISDPYDVVPSDACFLVESIDLPGFFNSITEGNGLFTEMNSVKELTRLTDEIKYLSEFISRTEFSRVFENARSVISFHQGREAELIPLLSMNVAPQINYRQVHDILKQMISNELPEIKKWGLKFLCLPYKYSNRPDTVFLTFNDGLLISSPSIDLIARAIFTPDKNIRSVPGFTRIMSAAGRNEDKLYLVFKNVFDIIKSFTGTKSPALAELATKLAGSAEGDVYINENGIILSGYTESVDSTDFLYKYKNHPSAKLTTYEVIPSDIVLFETIYLPQLSPNNFSKENVDDSTYSLAVRLTPFMGDEISRAYLDFKNEKDRLTPVMIFKLKNRDMTEQIISRKIKLWGRRRKMGEQGMIRYFMPDEQTQIPVYITPYKNIASVYYRGFKRASDDSYITFYDNYMITGSSYDNVTSVLYDNMLNNTLANNVSYRDFESTMPSIGCYSFYCIPSGIITYLSQWLDDDVIDALSSNRILLKKIQAAGYQFTASNDMIYNTLSIKFGEEVREESGTEWETLLDTAACIKPFFFTNHNTGAKEIFIQDYKNNTYLVNAAGRVLWKVPLNERILGDVYMIDFYGNGKYQILFSGKNYLHLLDRNGNYVERYPVKLRSPATAPLALFDYDNNKVYRLFIPGEDRLIYAYDKEGGAVKGWKPFRTNTLVTTELRFFRVSGKDYLVAADNNSVYFLDRTGNVRLKPKEAVVRAHGSEIRLAPGRNPGIVFSSPEGVIQRVSFDGSVNKTEIRKFSSDHSFDFFDVDGDGFGEYIFIDSGILYLYKIDRSEIFSRDFGPDKLEGPINFIFSALDRKIGIFDDSKKLIYLIDKNGDALKGFPLRGASLFSIGKFSEASGYHLIVGGSDSFLYNYRIESGLNQTE